jgi:DNA-directed RNA polymerase specialized sigma24 family protein
VPLSGEPQDDDLDAARRIARLVVEAFLGDHECIGIDDKKDLMEILVEHWWLHAGAFKQAGPASRDTYMRVMFRNKLLELRAATRTAKRGGGVRLLSLDSPANPQDAESQATLAETIIDRTGEAEVERTAANNELRRALTDLRLYLAKEDWELLEALWQDPRPRPAGERLGIHPSTVSARLARIRAVAKERGLHFFL